MISTAKWITAPIDVGSGAVAYRRSFELRKDCTNAVLNVSAVGIYDAKINGCRLTGSVLNPGFTSYKKRI